MTEQLKRYRMHSPDGVAGAMTDMVLASAHAAAVAALEKERDAARHDLLFFMTCLLTQCGGQFELTRRAMIDAPTHGSFTIFDDPVSGSRIYRAAPSPPQTEGE